jgi:hypothetical protein
MTEQEWLECSDPGPMLKFLRHSRPTAQPLKEARRSKRKTGLFLCACYQRGWSTLSPECRTLVDDYERYCDGMIAWQAVERAYWAMIDRRDEMRRAEDEKEGRISFVSWVSPSEHFSNPGALAGCLARHAANGETATALAAELQAHCQLLRDIFNPFCAAILAPAWLNATVKQLAELVYQERAFDTLPILADALEDAGCDDAALLGHLRGPGPHVRGCWAVDLLLGKT